MEMHAPNEVFIIVVLNYLHHIDEKYARSYLQIKLFVKHKANNFFPKDRQYIYENLSQIF